VPILSQINPVHVLPTEFFMIRSNIIFHLRQGLPMCLFPSGFPTKTVYIYRLHCHTFHISAPIEILDLIMQTTFGGGCKPWSSLLCNLLQRHKCPTLQSKSKNWRFSILSVVSLTALSGAENKQHWITGWRQIMIWKDAKGNDHVSFKDCPGIYPGWWGQP